MSEGHALEDVATAFAMGVALSIALVAWWYWWRRK